MNWNYRGLAYVKWTIRAFVLTLIFIGLIIGFFVTGYAGLLFIAGFVGLIDLIIICAIFEPLKAYIKYLCTGEWEK